MKYLDAKRDRSAASSNKMLGGPPADKRASGDIATGSVRPDVQALADALAVDLSAVVGTGKKGTITKADVRQAVSLRDAAAKEPES